MSSPVDIENVEFSAAANRKVYVNETSIIPVGAAVCYDRTRSTVGQRDHYCSKPSLTNDLELAGVVTSQGKQQSVGPHQMDIVSLETLTRGVQVLTDENVAVGDFLSPVPGTWYWGKAVRGRPVFRCTEAFDGTTTPGLVKGDFGYQVIQDAEQSGKIVRVFDHFAGAQGMGISGTADATKFVLTGTSATAIYSDSFGPEKSASAQGNGVLTITTNTTNIANLSLNGEPFRLDTGKSAFFRARAAVDVITADSDIFFGLHITDVSYWAGNADQVGVRIVDGAVQVVMQKSTSGLVTIATGVSVAAGDFVEVAILARNRAAAVGKKDLLIWVNGTQISYTNNDTDRAEFPDTESLTFIAEASGSAARALSLDFVEVGNYVG